LVEDLRTYWEYGGKVSKIVPIAADGSLEHTVMLGELYTQNTERSEDP